MRQKKISDEDVARSVIQSKTKEELERVYDLIQALRKVRRFEKLKSSYIESTKRAVLYNKENKVYFDFRLDGTVTGRLSCGAAETKDDTMGISLHTIPRVTEELNIRKIYIAPTNHKFICADYKSMELRVLAMDSKDQDLLKAFWSGQDLHKYTASLIFNKPISEISKDERQIAKSVSFLLIYGGKAFKLAKTANISVEEAEQVYEAYFRAYPGVPIWMENVENFIRKNKYSINAFKRRELLPNVSSPDKRLVEQAIRQGINFKIQSFASDLVCYAAIDIHKEFKNRGMEARIAGMVHDSIESICPNEEEQEAVAIIKDKMTNQYTVKKLYPEIDFNIPLEVDVEVGLSFGG